MRNISPEPQLRRELDAADDAKIRLVTAMLDAVSDATGKQAILDPLRARLGWLKPERPLRFGRLLFMPLDPLIVPANLWRPGQATVPRSVLASLTGVVRAGLGTDTALIDGMIAEHKGDATQRITRTGAALWPLAAEILAQSSEPSDWAETGLRPAFYVPLAQAIAAVLRRATRLRTLLRDGDVAALKLDAALVNDILKTLAEETAEGCAMVVELILLQSPHAAPLLRDFMASSHNSAEKASLRQALARGTDQALSLMEQRSGMIDGIVRAPIAIVGEQVRRINAMLSDIGDAASSAGDRPRVKAIRDRLEAVCRTRFAHCLDEDLVQPLAEAAGPVDARGQTRFETCARDLRALEAVVRKGGMAGGYDRLLTQASEQVEAAASAGTLTPMRQLRLIEILAGSEVAAAMHRKALSLAQ